MKDLTSTKIKVIAMLLMLMDHVHQFIPNIPVWFSWLGRISAPLFFFSMAWGLHYTRNRKKYLIRLYLFGLFMATGDILLSMTVKNPIEPALQNNIMTTLFLTAYLGVAIDYLVQQKSNKPFGLYMLLSLFIVQVISLGAIFVLGPTIGATYTKVAVNALLPNLLYCEGSFIFVFYGVAMYFVRNSKIGLVLINVIVSALFFIPAWQTGILEAINTNYQWMMIGSVVFMLGYSGKKGKGLKWLFYVFYPLHIYLLFWMGSFF